MLNNVFEISEIEIDMASVDAEGCSGCNRCSKSEDEA